MFARPTGFGEAGEHDVVVLALKAHQIAEIADALPALFGPESVVVTVQNGIPWWYFKKHGGAFDGKRLESLDPDGAIERNIGAERIVGSIAYPAAEKPAPGVIRHVEGLRFPLGELDGAKTERVKAISKLFARAGFRAPVLSDIRAQVWLKAWGNLSFNPISALTRATLAEICRFPATRRLAADMMGEAKEIAEKLGVTFRHTIEQRIAGAEGVGRAQDVDAARCRSRPAARGRGPGGSRGGAGPADRHAYAVNQRGLRERKAAGADARPNTEQRDREPRTRVRGTAPVGSSSADTPHLAFGAHGGAA